jgi:FAD/FMN-containing dehydrogenase/Fe-S oxidoreductase
MDRLANETASLDALRMDLAALGVDVDVERRRIAEYSYDASNYRVPPVAVTFPRGPDDIVATVRTCRRHGVPVTLRGGGTSMAGNAIGAGVVIDLSRRMDRMLSIDVESRTAVVEPGIVLTDVQRAVRAASGGTLTFAPDPSSQSRATVGGAIGNDACGNHSVRHGRTADHIVSLELVSAGGHRLTATRTGLVATDPQDESAVAEAERITEGLTSLAFDNAAAFRKELDQIPRQVSGYHLAHLLPERGFDVARALVGAEGTCAVVVAATVSLVAVAHEARLMCLGYDDLVDAARDTVTILHFDPAAIEGIDDAIVETMRHRRGDGSVVGLPKGRAWLYVELDGDDSTDVGRRCDELVAALRGAGRLVDARIVTDPEERASLWRVREDGAGLSSRLVDGSESWGGWEDSAVAPERLGDYLTEIRALLARFGLTGVMYGHFGAGCMHIRIDFDQRTDEGRATMFRFIREAAALCIRYGGSISGEHGDGRARSELLPLMYSESVISAFARFKALWDPDRQLSPGVITDPAPFAGDLALDGVPTRGWESSFHFPGDGDIAAETFPRAVQRCIGVGRCRATTGGVMCPSFRATGDEKDSTRARARGLQEMVRSSPTIADGWRSEEVRESLDLCLSCKACSSDCPVGVDMATYKSEFLDHYYRGRLRPMSHYSLGWLPVWARATSYIAPVLNRVGGAPWARPLVAAGGLTAHRAIPQFASRRRIRSGLGGEWSVPGDVIVLADTFTRAFRPEVAGAASRVLAESGLSPQCRTDACCGLTWISTGQLSRARKVLTRAARLLDDGTDCPIIVLEPSCAAALRKDLPELVDSAGARRVAARVRSFAQAIQTQATSGWTPSAALPAEVTVQSHCHEYSVFGATSQRDALRAVGVGAVREATGCCGVAGNFGFERDHYAVSMKVAEQALAPALRSTPESAVVLTDGFSCHMQVGQLDPGRRSIHLAQLLDPRPPS